MTRDIRRDYNKNNLPERQTRNSSPRRAAALVIFMVGKVV